MNPHRICAGVDASGDQRSGNHKFMAVVIGTEERIAATVRRLGTDRIHMSSIKNLKKQTDIINKVKFDGRECIGLCIRLEKKRVLEEAQKRVKRRQPRANTMKVRSTYHHIVWETVDDRVDRFLWQHGCSLGDISFQCDADCKDLARDMRWCMEKAGSAHMLADIVAWANGHVSDHVV